MRNHWLIVLLAACCWTAGLNSPANAQQDSSVVLPPPAGAEVVVTTARPIVAIPAQCIEYRTHLGARRAYRCSGEKQVIAITKNPIDCCDYEVPLCIPCSCEGAPSVTSECGLLGRGRVEYCWDSGFTATVVFKGNGDVKVHYRG